MTGAIISFPVERTTQPRRELARGTHQVFIIPAREGRRIVWSVEETRVDGDWWGWIADASSFEEALKIANEALEPGGIIDCLLERIESET